MTPPSLSLLSSSETLFKVRVGRVYPLKSGHKMAFSLDFSRIRKLLKVKLFMRYFGEPMLYVMMFSFDGYGIL